MIVAIRIDERLIHGQVATMWTNSLKVTRIMVVDDTIIKNEMEKEVLKLAKPGNVKLSILSVRTAADRILADNYMDQRVFLLVKNPETLVQLISYGVAIKEINVGNLSATVNSRAVTKSVHVDDKQAKAFKELHDAKVNLQYQMVPNEEGRDFYKMMEDVGKWN